MTREQVAKEINRQVELGRKTMGAPKGVRGVSAKGFTRALEELFSTHRSGEIEVRTAVHPTREFHSLTEDERKIRRMKNKSVRLRRQMRGRKQHGRTTGVAR